MGTAQVIIAAGDGTEMQQFAIFAQRDGKDLGDMDATDWITDQARGLRGIQVAWGLQGTWRGGL